MKIFDFFKRQVMGIRGTVDCNEFADKLFDSIDGEISEEKLRKMAKHMEMCSPCKDAYELEMAIKEAIAKKVKREKVPDELLNDIKRKVQDFR